MTETEKMRAILNERGIEYRDVNNMVTDIEHDGIKTRVYDYDDGPDYQLCVEQKWLTAEEAVRVALGIKPQEVLERRIDELCAEVERRKSEFKKMDVWHSQELKAAMDENAKLREQNTELRELVRAMYYCNLPWKDCDKCAMNGADMHVEIDEMEFCDGMNDRLRELGVVK